MLTRVRRRRSVVGGHSLRQPEHRHRAVPRRRRRRRRAAQERRHRDVPGQGARPQHATSSTRRRMNARPTERLALETELRHAHRPRRARAALPAQGRPRTGAIVGVEALVRWQHPSAACSPPARSSRSPRRPGSSCRSASGCSTTACAQTAAWHDAGLPRLPVAVNLSARQFEQQTRPRAGRAALRETRACRRGLLELELTESLRDAGPDASRRGRSRELQAMGVRCSIDDFGTGYSGLSYLPVPDHHLKIDRSFVRTLDGPDGDSPIVRGMIALAHSLGLGSSPRASRPATSSASCRARLRRAAGLPVQPGRPRGRDDSTSRRGRCLRSDPWKRLPWLPAGDARGVGREAATRRRSGPV